MLVSFQFHNISVFLAVWMLFSEFPVVYSWFSLFTGWHQYCTLVSFNQNYILGCDIILQIYVLTILSRDYQSALFIRMACEQWEYLTLVHRHNIMCIVWTIDWIQNDLYKQEIIIHFQWFKFLWKRLYRDCILCHDQLIKSSVMHLTTRHKLA